MENTGELFPHCPILGRPVRRTRPAGSAIVEVSCPLYEVATGRCRFELDPVKEGRLSLLLAVVNETGGRDERQCVMQ